MSEEQKDWEYITYFDDEVVPLNAEQRRKVEAFAEEMRVILGEALVMTSTGFQEIIPPALNPPEEASTDGE